MQDAPILETWTFNAQDQVLEHIGVPDYYIPYEQMGTSAEVLNWIFQINEKSSWATDQTVRELVQAFVYLVGRGICSGGFDHPVNVADLKRRAESWSRKTSSLDRQTRVEPPVDGHSSGGGPAGQEGDDFWGDLETLLGRPVIVISAADLCNGDYGKASRPRGVGAGSASRRPFTRR